jgi:hypothetical protein
MARYNTSSSTNTITGAATIASPFQGAFTQFSGSAPYTVTLPAPAAFPGVNQTFYNATGGVVTVSTPSGAFTGTGGPNAATFAVNSGNVLTVVPDGTNYIVISEDGSPLVATTGSFSGNVSITSGTTSLTPGSFSLTPSSTAGTIDNTNIGATTRGTGAFNALTANQAVTFTANTSSSSSTTGSLVVTGGIGASGNIYSGANIVATNLTGTLQTAAQTNITSIGTLAGLTSSSSINQAANNGLLFFTPTGTASGSTATASHHFIGRIDTAGYHLTTDSGGFSAPNTGSLVVGSHGTNADLILATGTGAYASGRVVITAAGNVGVNTATAANKVQIGSVGSSGYSGNDLAIGNGTQVMSIYMDPTGPTTFYTNTRFAFLPSGSGSTGNVGIGFSLPVGKLDVAGDLYVGTSQNTARFKSDGTNTYVDAIPSSSAVVIRTNGSVERMRIDAAGRVTVAQKRLDSLIGYDTSLLYSQQEFIENGNIGMSTSGGTLPTFVTVNSTAMPFGKVMSFSNYWEGITDEYIPVNPGDVLYGEMWAFRASGAAGAAGGFYAGVSQWDKDKMVTAGNIDLSYFVASGATVPTSGTWTKYSGYFTVKSSHTPYNGSDGGPVRYIRPYLIINYSSGTIPTQFSGFIIRQVSINRDQGPVAVRGERQLRPTLPLPTPNTVDNRTGIESVLAAGYQGTSGTASYNGVDTTPYYIKKFFKMNSTQGGTFNQTMVEIDGRNTSFHELWIKITWGTRIQSISDATSAVNERAFGCNKFNGTLINYNINNNWSHIDGNSDTYMDINVVNSPTAGILLVQFQELTPTAGSSFVWGYIEICSCETLDQSSIITKFNC